MMLEPEDAKQYAMYKQGIIGEGFDQEELVRYAAMAKQEGVEVPVTGAASGAAGMPMILEPEDMAQYAAFKAGMISPDMDAEELAVYAAMANAEGVEVPQTGGVTLRAARVPPSAMLEPEDAKQYAMYKQGLIGEGFDQEELVRYAAMAKAEGIEIPTNGGAGAGAGGLPPSAMLEPEDAKQYAMYKQGIITADFDQSEIARYAAMAKAEGIEIPLNGGAGAGAGGLPPSAMLEGEDAKQYALYKQGIITSNMDPDEIAMYAAMAKQ